MSINFFEYADLSPGQTRKGKCPECGKYKYYVTRKPDGFAYICFRATCPLEPGFVTTTHVVYNKLDRELKELSSNRPMPNPYEGKIFHCNEQDMEYFSERFGLFLGDSPSEASHFIRCSDDNRYVLPIYGPVDQLRGHVLRRPVWDGEPSPPMADDFPSGYPKTMNYWITPSQPKLAWYDSTEQSTVVIVEDQISAIRISNEGVTSVALLGTNFTPNMALDIQRWGGKRYILALDPDALTKAVAISRKWGSIFPGGRLEVAALPTDPKDYNGDILEALRV